MRFAVSRKAMGISCTRRLCIQDVVRRVGTTLLAATPAEPEQPDAEPTPPLLQFVYSVRMFSSQYGTRSYSVGNITGPPSLYPKYVRGHPQLLVRALPIPSQILPTPHNPQNKGTVITYQPWFRARMDLGGRKHPVQRAPTCHPGPEIAPVWI